MTGTGLWSQMDSLICFIPTKVEKHTREGYILNLIKIKEFKKKTLDPVCCLKEYIERTKKIRSSNQLFIIINKPHSAASKETIARRLSQVIAHSGQHGTGGSVRSAVTSKAVRGNVSEQSILQAGEWSRYSTFQRFYNKIEPDFAETVPE